MPQFHAYTISLHGRVVYVGITSGPVEVRWAQHTESGTVHCRLLAAAIREHGADASTVEHVASASTRGDILAVERALIAQHRTRAPHGFNLTSGSVEDGNPSTARPDRTGMVQMPYASTKPVKKQLRMMAAEMDTTQQEPVTRALNLLFAQHGKPPIA